MDRRQLCTVLAVLTMLIASGTRLCLAGYPVTDLVDAAKRGDGHAVHALLGLRPEAVNDTDGEGYTALHWAAIRGHWRIFQELLAAAAPVNRTGADGGTALHWACHHDRADMVGLLLAAGADPGKHNRWGRTPLHVAARRNCLEVAALLLAHGADPNQTTREGWTCLHVASRSGHEVMQALLLAHGADAQLRDGQGLLAAESVRQRPAPVAIASATLDDLVGIYDLGHGATVKVWRTGDQLHLQEYAPDELYPIGPDRFFCRREPWQVVFQRSSEGQVTGIELQFLRRTVTGTRTETPHYVGAAVCKACHLEAHQGGPYLRWVSSRHAHAYWRLAADWALVLGRMRPQYHDLEQPLTDERCLLCHVTGRQQETSLLATTYRQEEGVSCEACHGPGSRYARPEVMADRTAFLANGGLVPDAETCRSCHRNSDRFSFAEWWPKIAH